MAEIDPATEAERRLLTGSARGRTIALSDLAPEERSVRADLLRAIWLDPAAGGEDLDVGGAHIRGRLNLEGATLRSARFSDTTFDDELVLRSATLTRLELVDCRLHVLRGLGAHFSHSFTVVRSRVLVGMGLDSICVTGAVRLQGLQIGDDPAVTCLSIRRASVGDLYLTDGCQVVGRVDLSGTTVAGEVGLDDATLQATAGPALSLIGVEAETFRILDSRFRAADGPAVFISGTRARNVLLADATVQGQVSLQHCEIEGLLFVDRCEVAGMPIAVVSTSSTIGTIRICDSSLSGLSCADTLILTSFGCLRSRISNRGGVALHLGLSTVRGLFSIEDVTFDGAVNLKESSLHILGDDLGNGPDRLGSWGSADGLLLNGLTYSFGEGANQEPALRHLWLAHTVDHEPSSWRQLSEVYQAVGQEQDAVRTLIAKEDDRLDRAQLSWRRKTWLRFLRVTIGYGYRSWLARVWSLAVIVVYSAIVSANASAFVADGRADLQPVAYAADTFLPIIDLDQAAHWSAGGWVAWTEWGVIIAGWVLSTLFVAGFTRIVRTL